MNAAKRSGSFPRVPCFSEALGESSELKKKRLRILQWIPAKLSSRSMQTENSRCQRKRRNCILPKLTLPTNKIEQLSLVKKNSRGRNSWFSSVHAGRTVPKLAESASSRKALRKKTSPWLREYEQQIRPVSAASPAARPTVWCLLFFTLRALLWYSSALISSPRAWPTWSLVWFTQYSMLSTISPCRTAQGTENVGLETGSGRVAHRGDSLVDGCTQSYIYIHIIGE